MDTYPSTFRVPELDGYSLTIYQGLLRTPEDAATPRQRTVFKQPHSVIGINFIIKQEDYGAWVRWWDDFAYAWFTMPIGSAFASLQGRRCINHTVRCIDNLAVAVVDKGYVKVSTTIELSPDHDLRKVS